jgi:hypothetical protein
VNRTAVHWIYAAAISGGIAIAVVPWFVIAIDRATIRELREEAGALRREIEGTDASWAADRKKLEKQALFFESHWARSQALLQMVADTPGMIDILRNPEFREKFRADWWQPAKFADLLGREWFIRELAAAKIGNSKAYGERLHYDFDRESRDDAYRLIEPQRWLWKQER